MELGRRTSQKFFSLIVEPGTTKSIEDCSTYCGNLRTASEVKYAYQSFVDIPRSNSPRKNPQTN